MPSHKHAHKPCPVRIRTQIVRMRINDPHSIQKYAPEYAEIHTHSHSHTSIHIHLQQHTSNIHTYIHIRRCTRYTHAWPMPGAMPGAIRVAGIHMFICGGCHGYYQRNCAVTNETVTHEVQLRAKLIAGHSPPGLIFMRPLRMNEWTLWLVMFRVGSRSLVHTRKGL